MDVSNHFQKEFMYRGERYSSYYHQATGTCKCFEAESPSLGSPFHPFGKRLFYPRGSKRSCQDADEAHNKQWSFRFAMLIGVFAYDDTHWTRLSRKLGYDCQPQISDLVHEHFRRSSRNGGLVTRGGWFHREDASRLFDRLDPFEVKASECIGLLKDVNTTSNDEGLTCHFTQVDMSYLHAIGHEINQLLGIDPVDITARDLQPQDDVVPRDISALTTLFIHTTTYLLGYLACFSV